MWIFTTAGFICVIAVPDSTDRHVIAYDADSFQTFVDGVEMIAGVEPTPLPSMAPTHRASVPADALAEWLAQEVREYTATEALEDAILASRGPVWAQAYDVALRAVEDATRTERENQRV